MRVCVLIIMLLTFVVALFSGQVRFPALGIIGDKTRVVANQGATRTPMTYVRA